MMTAQPGDIWVANILFTDGSASKKRPVLILWLDANDVVVAAITSAVPCSVSDLALNDWKASGLRIASTVRLARLDCLEKSLRVTKLGRISIADASQIQKVWSMNIKPQF